MVSDAAVSIFALWMNFVSYHRTSFGKPFQDWPAFENLLFSVSFHAKCILAIHSAVTNPLHIFAFCAVYNNDSGPIKIGLYEWIFRVTNWDEWWNEDCLRKCVMCRHTRKKPAHWHTYRFWYVEHRRDTSLPQVGCFAMRKCLLKINQKHYFLFYLLKNTKFLCGPWSTAPRLTTS